MTHFESRSLGCLFDSKNFYIQLWDEYLPENAHELCSGRLFISVTLYPSMTNNVLSTFHTRQDLIQAIVASTCLPYLFMRDYPVDCGPSQGGLAVDGGFSNDSPCLDSYTITVSALMDEADIVPHMKKGEESMSASSCQGNSTASNVTDGEGAGDVKDSLDNIPNISFLDIVRTPLYSRVWEIGQLGERSASQCPDFERHEWQAVHKSVAEMPPPSPDRYTVSFHKPSDPLYIPMFSRQSQQQTRQHEEAEDDSFDNKSGNRNRKRLHSC